MANSSAFRVQKDLKEVAELSWEDSAPVMATPTSDHLTNLTALVVGPPGTCYHGGFLTFSVKPTGLYPNEPPAVKCLSTSEGKVRLNPNLYADGKVCLSVLGTYRGETSESWRSSYSLRYLLQCIQSMVLNEEPYHNEPGFSKQTRQRGVQLLLPANHPGAKTPGILDLGEEPERNRPGSSPALPTEEELDLEFANGENEDDAEAKKKAQEKKAKEKEKRKVRRYLVSAKIIQDQADGYHEKITHESIRITVCDVLECLLSCKAPEYIPPTSAATESSSSPGENAFPESPQAKPLDAETSSGSALLTPQASVSAGGTVGGAEAGEGTPELVNVMAPSTSNLSNDGGENEDGDFNSTTQGTVPLDALISNATTPAMTPVTSMSTGANGNTFSNMGTAELVETPVTADQPILTSAEAPGKKPNSTVNEGTTTNPETNGSGKKSTSPSATTVPTPPPFKVSAPSWQSLSRKSFLECSRVELFSAEIKRQFLIRYESYIEICSKEERLTKEGEPFTSVMFEFPNNAAAGHFTWRWLLHRLENIKKALTAETDAWMLKGRELTQKKTYGAVDLASEASRISNNVPSASGSLVDPGNAYHWNLCFMSPEGLYEEGFYTVEVFFCPAQDQPPRCRFVQPIWHPNVSQEGYSVHFLWDDRAMNGGGSPSSDKMGGSSSWTPTQVAKGVMRLLTGKPLQYPAVILNAEAAALCFSADEAEVKEFRKKARRLARRTVE